MPSDSCQILPPELSVSRLPGALSKMGGEFTSPSALLLQRYPREFNFTPS